MRQRSIAGCYQNNVAWLYLLEQGHRRIAFIAGLPGSPSGEQRLAGFLDTLKAAGIEHDEALRLEGDWTPESGYRAAQTLLARNLDVTCVLAANDDIGDWRGEGVS